MRYACCSLDGRGGHEAGWALLRQLYLEETGQPLPPVRLTKRGKPYFPDSPYHFSISHTRRHAACVLGKYPVGLDLEELNRPIRQKGALPCGIRPIRSRPRQTPGISDLLGAERGPGQVRRYGAAGLSQPHSLFPPGPPGLGMGRLPGGHDC